MLVAIKKTLLKNLFSKNTNQPNRLLSSSIKHLYTFGKHHSGMPKKKLYYRLSRGYRPTHKTSKLVWLGVSFLLPTVILVSILLNAVVSVILKGTPVSDLVLAPKYAFCIMACLVLLCSAVWFFPHKVKIWSNFLRSIEYLTAVKGSIKMKIKYTFICVFLIFILTVFVVAVVSQVLTFGDWELNIYCTAFYFSILYIQVILIFLSFLLLMFIEWCGLTGLKSFFTSLAGLLIGLLLTYLVAPGLFCSNFNLYINEDGYIAIKMKHLIVSNIYQLPLALWFAFKVLSFIEKFNMILLRYIRNMLFIKKHMLNFINSPGTMLGFGGFDKEHFARSLRHGFAFLRPGGVFRAYIRAGTPQWRGFANYAVINYGIPILAVVATVGIAKYQVDSVAITNMLALYPMMAAWEANANPTPMETVRLLKLLLESQKFNRSTFRTDAGLDADVVMITAFLENGCTKSNNPLIEYEGKTLIRSDDLISTSWVVKKKP